MRKFINSLGGSNGEAIKSTWLIVVQAGQSNAESNSSDSLDPNAGGTPPAAKYTGVQSNVIKTSINIP